MSKYDKMIEENQRKSKEKIELALQAIQDMLANKERISVPKLMKKTGLSRGFFYKNPTVRDTLNQAVEQQAGMIDPRREILNMAMEKQIELLNHDVKNLRQDYRKYFEQVVMQMYIEADKQKIYLNHCPFLCYGGSYNGTWQLFGHVHTSRHNTGKDAPRLKMLFPTQYDVGVDNNDFTPVSFARVKAIIEKQIEQSKKGEQ